MLCFALFVVLLNGAQAGLTRHLLMSTDSPSQDSRLIRETSQLIQSGDQKNNEGLSGIDFDKGEHVTSARAHETMNTKDLPENFFWGDVDGVNYLTPVQTQSAPRKCFGCWAFAVVSALSDRVNIRRNGTRPDIALSVQSMLNCQYGGTCSGGNPHRAFESIAEHGIPDQTCQPYLGYEGECNALGTCKVCEKGDNCTAVEKFDRYFVDNYGWVARGSIFDGDHNLVGFKTKMRAEIYKNGPIPCTIRTSDKFKDYKGGIFSEFVFNLVPNHVIVVVGWGEENGERYWIGRNSWGTGWGENGYFKIATGNPFMNLGIELFCTFGDPILPEDEEEITFGMTFLNDADQDGYWDAIVHDALTSTGLHNPTLMKNERVPLGCGSGWAFSATSALGDRMKLMTQERFPDVELSPQMVINCAKPRDSPMCDGSVTPGTAYDLIAEKFVVDDTCSAYEGLELDCRAVNICRKCHSKGCLPVPDGEFLVYNIEDHGEVEDKDAMQQVIDEQGPVACGICIDNQFKDYKSGILESSADQPPCTEPNHYVEVVGSGSLDGKEYWLIRNSYGTYWGINGWALVSSDPTKDYGMSQKCYWAIPSPMNATSFPDELRP